MMPAMCPHHASVYATRLEALKVAAWCPASRVADLAAEAATVAGQCPLCPKETA